MSFRIENVIIFPGDNSGGETPVPIPNTAVKPSCADGTAEFCGRVGRCQDLTLFFSRLALRWQSLFFFSSPTVGAGGRQSALRASSIWRHLPRHRWLRSRTLLPFGDTDIPLRFTIKVAGFIIFCSPVTYSF